MTIIEVKQCDFCGRHINEPAEFATALEVDLGLLPAKYRVAPHGTDLIQDPAVLHACSPCSARLRTALEAVAEAGVKNYELTHHFAERPS